MKFRLIAFVMFVLSITFFHSFVVADAPAQGTIDTPDPIHLPVILLQPTPTPSPTPTAIPTATPTLDPNVPHPHDNDPKTVAIRPADVPNGWIIEEDGYTDFSSDPAAKRIVSSYYSFFLTQPTNRAFTVQSDVRKYLAFVRDTCKKV